MVHDNVIIMLKDSLELKKGDNNELNVEDKELKNILKIYKELEDSKRYIWAGNGNFLLGAQKMEEESKKKNGNVKSGSNEKEKEKANLLLDSTNNL